MKVVSCIMFVLSVFSVPVAAQIVEGHHEEMLQSMDVAEQRHEALHFRSGEGQRAVEDAKPQDLRYQEMTEAMDQGIIKHFNVLREKGRFQVE